MLTSVIKSDKKFLVALLLILFTGIIILRLQAVPHGLTDYNVQRFPLEFNGWRGVDLTMSPDAIGLIKPDMFSFRNYTREDEMINVYVGYYNNLDKSDLAHSPLVCYPGSGWIIRDRKNVVINIDGQEIPFNQLLIEKGSLQNLVIYGYKAGGLSTSSFIRLRLHLVANKLFGKTTASAFIRFSTDFINNEEEETRNLVKTFLQDFHIHIDKLFNASS